MTAQLDLADIQGLLVRGYGHLPHATFLLLHLDDVPAARPVLARWADEVTAARPSPTRTATHLGLTAAGARLLCRGGQLPEGFSASFAAGMTDPHRSRLLGDVGENDPSRWRWGRPGSPVIHLVLLLYARTPQGLDELVRRVDDDATSAGVRVLHRLGTDRLSDREPFGFRDGISQPVLEGLPRARDSRDVVRAGEFVLGYRNEYGQLTERPMVPPAQDPDHRLPRDRGGSGYADLGRNGSYLVVRQLGQDVEAFWDWAERATRGPDGASSPARRDLLAAKAVGRWPSGAPLVLSPSRDDPSLGHENDFGYHHTDPLGLACPVGAHVRRANPRDALEPAPGTERSRQVNRRHRLLRRGRSYTGDEPGDRGVHFLCLNANLARQYEFVQHTWVDDPAFNGLHDCDDPLVGPRVGGSSELTVPAWPLRRRYTRLPQFVRVHGGAYVFLPGLAALRHIVSPSGLP